MEVFQVYPSNIKLGWRSIRVEHHYVKLFAKFRLGLKSFNLEPPIRLNSNNTLLVDTANIRGLPDL